MTATTRPQLIEADVLAGLGQIEAGSVQCVVTSPPYWGLRDYGIPPTSWPEVNYSPLPGMSKITIPKMVCCLGLEATPEAFIGHCVHVFDEVRRVLRPDGTLWLNMGDSYTSGKSKSIPEDGWVDGESDLGWSNNQSRKPPPGLKPKDLVGMPWRLALALQAAGWRLRSDIVWSKPNPMPESCRDRPTKAHEYIFLMTKSARYHYDQEAVKEAVTGNAHSRGDGLHPKLAPAGSGIKSNESWSAATNKLVSSRNLRTVWKFPTQAYPGAHFATFPEALPERCIKAGTSPKACAVCGAPWRRLVDRTRSFESGSGKSGNLPSGKNGPNLQGGGETLDIRRGPVVHTKTTGWAPTCDHDAPGGLSVVLDPFAGSGTTLAVAARLGRASIGIEISPEYARLARKRCKIDRPSLESFEQPLPESLPKKLPIEVAA